MKDHNNSNNNETRTTFNHSKLVKNDFIGDEAWIKVNGIPEISNGEFPDDMPLPKTTYLGPFAVYEF